MIISKTPLRISFVGGGTDLKDFYTKEFGQIISTTIDKYIYVVARKQTSVAKFKYRINWSKVEFTQKINEIKHPIAREAFKLLNINFPCEISTFSDIPANTGLGSSSTFAVGLLNALYALKGVKISKKLLAEQAVKIEVEILKRNIGKQDHYAASYGGMNVITFNTNMKTDVKKIKLKKNVSKLLFNNLLLFFTGQTRDSSKILKTQKSSINKNFKNLKQMRDYVQLSKNFLLKGRLDQFAQILDKNWKLKKKLSKGISNSKIEKYYKKALKAGAHGGKLLGAGAGGFLCFYVEKKNQKAVIKSLKDLKLINFGPDHKGSQIIFNH